MADKTVRIIVKGVDEVSGTFDNIGKKIGGRGGLAGALGKVGMAAGTAVVASVAAAGAGLGAFAASGIQKAASLEQQLANIASVMGKTSAEVAPLNDLILDLGMAPDLKVDTFEAAEAIEVLARNGLQMDQIMKGAAKSAILLSNATGGSMAGAADVATDVMALWNIEAANMERAVDGITSVVTNSKFSFDDFRLALAQGGGVAAAVGVSFEDFNAAIAAISPSFASGSDAGTSFKVLLQRLVPKSDAATGAMKQLGIITADGANQFFDAEGNMRSMADIAGILANATAGLSDEQKNAAFSTIFGTDAMRAAFGLAEVGETQFRKLQETMGKTSAAEAVATRMDTLSGQFEILQGQIEGVAIKIGKAFMPILKDLVKRIGTFVDEHADQFVAMFENLAKFIAAVMPKAFSFVSMLVSLGKYLLFTLTRGDSLNDWLTHLPKPIQGVVRAFGGMVEFLRNTVIKVFQFLVDLWKAEVSGAARIVASIWNNVLLPAFMRAWQFLQDSVIPIFNIVVDWLRRNIPKAISFVAGFIADTLIPAWGKFIEFVQSIVFPILATVFDWLKINLPIALQFLADLWENTLVPAIAVASDFIQNTLIPAFSNASAWLREKLPQALAGFFGGMQSGFASADPLIQAFSTAWSFIKNSVMAALQVIGPAMGEWWANFQEGFKQFGILGPTFAEFWEAIKPIVIGAVLLIGAAIAGLMGILAGLQAGAAQAIKPFLTTIAFLVNGVVKLLSGLVNFIAGTLSFVVGVITGNADLMAEGWERAWKGIVQITEGLIFAIVGTIFGAIQTLGAWVEGFTQGIIDFFNHLYDALVGGSIIPDLVKRALSLFRTLKDDGLGILNELVTGAIGLGNDLISGLAGAIQGGLGTVTGAIGGLLNSAISTAQDTLKSGSPSKVFMGFGEGIGTGLTAGMRSMMGVVQKEAQGLTSLGGLSTMAPAAVGAGGGGTTIINNYIDGVRVSSTTTGGGNAEDQAMIQLVNKIRRQIQLSR